MEKNVGINNPGYTEVLKKHGFQIEEGFVYLWSGDNDIYSDYDSGSSVFDGITITIPYSISDMRTAIFPPNNKNPFKLRIDRIVEIYRKGSIVFKIRFIGEDSLVRLNTSRLWRRVRIE